jgi:hypothetical protein
VLPLAQWRQLIAVSAGFAAGVPYMAALYRHQGCVELAARGTISPGGWAWRLARLAFHRPERRSIVIDFGDLATWVSAGVAVGAAGFAWRQTGEARKARVAAEAQAVEAAKSREAAETQARAAEDQVALMRAERDERDGPEFFVSAIDAFPEVLSYSAAEVVLRMERGRALHSVTVTASGRYLVAGGLRRRRDGSATAAGELTFDGVRPGSELVFDASTEQGYLGSKIDLDLTCRERDGDDGRTWHCPYARTIDQAPRPRPPLAAV